MAAISMPLAARAEYTLHQLAKRDNWAQREPGVIVVFCIVFLVAVLFLAMFINKKVCAMLPLLTTLALFQQRTNNHYRGKPARASRKIPNVDLRGSGKGATYI